MSSGSSLGGYTLRERLGVGGMAEIYRAVRSGPEGFAKTVALKVVLPDLCRDPQFVALFQQEARLAAQLSSPHLVQVFDFGCEQGRHYLVMEHVDGVDLAALLAGHAKGLPLELALHVARQLCAALSDLHAAADTEGHALNIVHRDVNPGNVLLSVAGDVKLGDFGIAKARARAVRTERGAIRGKLAYLSPEQVRGEEADARTDIYGVGLVLFEVLTGERYLAAESEAELLRAAADPPPRSPSQLREGLPAGIDEIVGRALAADAARRYAEARWLDAALRDLVHLPDAAALRRDLGARVQQARRGAEQELAETPGPADAAGSREGEAGEIVERAAEPDRVRPRTEVLVDRAPRAGLRRGTFGALVLIAALAVGAFWLLVGRGEPPVVEVDWALVAGDAQVAFDAREADAPEAADAAAGRDGARTARVVDVAIGRVPPPPRRARADVGLGGVVAARGRDAAPDAARLAPASSTADEVRELLDRAERLLREKGILAADVPPVFTRRRTLAAALEKGSADRAGARALLRSIEGLTVDRAFVHAKLQRLSKAMQQATLAPQIRARLQQRARLALSHAVTGRYVDANHELNAIARILER